MLKIVNDKVPSYLRNLMLNRVGDQAHYHLRKKHNYKVTYSWLCYENSYFPSTLRLWNEQDLESSLKADLNRVNIVRSAPCSCETVNESAKLYFFDGTVFYFQVTI